MNELGNGLPDRGIYHGNSMGNVFTDGDTLIFEDVPFDKLECGDIVAVFERSPYYVHRIVEKDENVATTMGDNNRHPDDLKLNRGSKFKLVRDFIPAKNPGRVLPITSGSSGMEQFRRRQHNHRIQDAARKALAPFLWLKYCRIPARKETRFRDGTIQWNFGFIPVAACNPVGETKYLGGWKRLFFRIPKCAASVQGPCMRSQDPKKQMNCDQ